MSIDIEKSATVIDTLKGMTGKELSVTILLIVLAVGLSFWFENRYAKLRDTQMHIQQQQTEIIQLQTQILNVVNSLPPEVRKEIIERSQTQRALNVDSSKFIAQ